MLTPNITHNPLEKTLSFRIPNRYQNKFLTLWHGVFSGAFIIAYISEDAYFMHAFAGYLVLGAVAIRVLFGLLASPKSPLALPNPMALTRTWVENVLAGRKARNPIVAWIGVGMLVSIAVASATGWIVDMAPRLDDLHEGAAEFTLAIIFAHLGFVAFRHVRKALPKLSFPDVLNELKRANT